MAFWDVFKRVKGMRFGFAGVPWSSPPERNTSGFLAAYGEIYSLFGICIRIATAVSEVKWRLYKGSERGERNKVTDHALLRLLDYANEFQTGQEITELMQLHMDLVGKAYWYLPLNKFRLPGEIWILPPHQVKIVHSKENFISGYIYTGAGEPIPISKDEIIRFSMPDPLNPYGSIGYAQAAAVELDSEIFAGKWNRNFFYNSARPDAALEYEETLTDDEFEKLRSQWQARHGGLSQAHKIAILEGGVKYKQIQISQKDMDFSLLRKQTRENLLFTFGMPLSVMGISENVNRANAEAGDYTFARWLIKPRLTRIKNKLNEQLVPKFGTGIELDFDEVVPETVEMKKGLAESGVRSGWMTINEARKLNGFDTVPKGDVFLIPFNMMPTPADKPIVPPPSAEAPKAKVRLAEEQKEAMWRSYAAKTESQEKPFIKMVGKLFDEQADEVVGNLKDAKKPEDALFDKDKAIEKFKDTFRPLIEEVFTEAAEEAFKQFPLDADALKWLATRSLALAKMVNGTTIEQLRPVLAEGFAAGESIPKLTRRIRDFYRNGYERRAATVARTEVIAASNEGSLWRYEKEGVEKAEFYAALDERTCDECMDYHGNEYKIEEAHGLIPVHPNCRCTFIPIV
jgi:HK97 family phage portal protein